MREFSLWSRVLGVLIGFVLLMAGLLYLSKDGIMNAEYKSSALGMHFAYQRGAVVVNEQDEGITISYKQYPDLPVRIMKQELPEGAGSLSQLLSSAGIAEDKRITKDIHGVNWASYYRTPENPEQLIFSAEKNGYLYHIILDYKGDRAKAQSVENELFRFVESVVIE